MRFSKVAAALLATVTTGALAGGPLYIHEPTMQPYKWDTSNGPIPVYTDGGPLIEDKDGNPVQTYTVLEAGTSFNHDMTLPDGTFIPAYTPLERDMTFLTIEQANAITARAVKEWSDVETSTLEMTVQGTIAEMTGISDVDATNVDQIYGAENGRGFWVNYDSDGSILEQYFGVPRNQVLGIAFPEWADEETGEITEATALMNGWFVDSKDTDGANASGVFTHEFGHAINMSHSQANGHLVYMAKPWSPQYDGVPGCAITNTYTSGTLELAKNVETMFPFIDVRGVTGYEQSTVNVRDDIVNISDLYPTAEYKAQYGSISGTLRTKDGAVYSGMNIVARNLDAPHSDVITQQSGNMTQGLVGPDGSFTINGLTPGGRYVLYIETIKAGGYPTAPTPLVSEAEYWNEGESSNPALDNACAYSEIIVAAGETKEVNMQFNGYQDGIKYTPLVQAYITDHSKNGQFAMGNTPSGTAFLYKAPTQEFSAIQLENGAIVKAGSANMNKNATKAGVIVDFDGDDIATPAIWDLRSNKLTPAEDLSNGTCQLSGQSGKSSASIWDASDDGNVFVGTARVAKSGAEECAPGESAFAYGQPVVWDGKGNLTKLPMELDRPYQPAWIRADRVSGNGETITGMINGFGQVAWVNGELRDINTEFGATEGSVISQDGRYVVTTSAVRQGRYTVGKGAVKWDTETDELEYLGSLRWCDDVPYNNFFFGNMCDRGYDHETLVGLVGLPNVLVLDANDDLSVITARFGSALAGGFYGAIYMEGMGWMTTSEFFARQGVVEARNLLADNIFGVSADASAMMGNLAGAVISIDIDIDKAFVCDKGQDRELSFPKQVLKAVEKGAEFGRCAHLNDRF
ncbi:carboxypeptidase-like regulatory domain-containing protein [Aestuariibacter salexigens]|uniref:carboxypeptidase-like regulatory domain-containing protein n=1 Tax=Aestuariibacter salexigens TaxID=226010 RepID=UPI000426C161|nr:carboxypeptidase-like regulatory domain-containing protein [Aestuariibacter salexigens]